MIESKKLLKQYNKLKTLPYRHKKNADDLFDQVIGNLLDEMHDKIDLASWESACRELLIPVQDGCFSLDVEKLKIEELETLVFYPCEFDLLRQLCLKDDYSLEHSLKVMAISLRVAHILGFSNTEKQILAKGAALHDIGKASCDPKSHKDYIDDYILKSYNQDVASDDEKNILKRHVEYGVRDLQNAYEKAGIQGSKIIDLMKRHHERIDGSGYPEGIALPQDDILSQILAFADTIEAMTAKQRTYQKTCSFDEIKLIFKQHLIDKFSDEILNLILDDHTRDLIEQEVEESRSVTEKIFFDL